MRLLYIDCYHHYLNPTSALLPALVSAAAEQVTFYGPGYSSAADLQSGLAAFVDRTAPYDAVMLGMQVPIFAWDESRLLGSMRHLNHYTVFSSSKEIVLPFFRDVLRNLARLPIRHKIISLLNFDYYATTERHTKVLESIDAYVITPGVQFAPRMEELPEWAWSERHFVRKRQMVSNAWNDFLVRNESRVISLPHFVSDGEFSFRGLADRRCRVSIPGVEYVMRRRGRSTLRERGIRPAAKPIFNLLRYADRLGLRVFSHKLGMAMYQAAYRGNLIDTRIVYSAREGFGIPVRKFFEIPAAGAVLLCVAPHNFKELGFINGEHFLEVGPDELPGAIDALEREPERAQRIAANGRQLVFDRHSFAARSEQLANCFQAIERGHFGGSRWNSGNFVVQSEMSIQEPRAI
jgi:hypothetical protein